VARPQTNQPAAGPVSRHPDYRIKRSAKSSNSTRGQKPRPPASTALPKVSPYAQPVLHVEDRRRKLLKLLHQ